MWRMRRHGFTLLEILIATAIFMTVMVVAIGVFGTTMSSSSTSNQLRTTSQTARYIFEAMARDIRSAHGLVISNPSGVQTVVIKPFEYLSSTGASTLIINQVSKSLDDTTGETKYQITRKTYKATSGAQPTLSVLVEETGSLTLTQVQGTPTFTVKNQTAAGQLVAAGTSMIPDDLVLKDFRVIRQVGYQSQIDTQQKTQPYIQLQLTIASKSAGFAGQSDKQAQTTLATTIVPRDFASPFEVAQSQITGGTQ